MHLTKKDRHNLVTKQVRGPDGHFVKESVSVSGTLEKLIDTSKSSSDDILDVKIHNPLHKIMQILQDIKNHQTTHFNLSFSIPLIALPVFLAVLFGVFQLGRAQIACVPVFSSKVGMLKTLSVMQSRQEPNPIKQLLSFFPQVPIYTQVAQLAPTTRIVLISQVTLDPITIIKNNTLNISSLENQHVIITGNYSSCSNAITLDSPENITPLK